MKPRIPGHFTSLNRRHLKVNIFKIWFLHSYFPIFPRNFPNNNIFELKNTCFDLSKNIGKSWNITEIKAIILFLSFHYNTGIPKAILLNVVNVELWVVLIRKRNICDPHPGTCSTTTRTHRLRHRPPSAMRTHCAAAPAEAEPAASAASAAPSASAARRRITSSASCSSRSAARRPHARR